MRPASPSSTSDEDDEPDSTYQVGYVGGTNDSAGSLFQPLPETFFTTRRKMTELELMELESHYATSLCKTDPRKPTPQRADKKRGAESR